MAFVVSAAALMAASVLVVFGSKDFVPEGACAMSTDTHQTNAMMRTAADRTKIRLRIRSLLVLSARYSMPVCGSQHMSRSSLKLTDAANGTRVPPPPRCRLRCEVDRDGHENRRGH